MNFQVPQFIETEDKIIGPLTLKQFFYVGTAGGLIFALFFILKFAAWVIASLILAVIAASFAFIKINGRPLMTILIAALSFYWNPRFYLWQHETEKVKMPELKIGGVKAGPSKSLLDSLWEQLKTSREPLPKREKAIEPSLLDRTKSSKERFEMMRKITGEKEMARRVDYR